LVSTSTRSPCSLSSTSRLAPATCRVSTTPRSCSRSRTTLLAPT